MKKIFKLLLIAWFFIHIGANGRGFVAGPFQTEEDCINMRTTIGGHSTFNSRCWSVRDSL